MCSSLGVLLDSVKARCWTTAVSPLLVLPELIARTLFFTVIFSNFTTLAPFSSPSSTNRSKLSSNEESLALEDGRRYVGDRKDDLHASEFSKRSSALELRPADQTCSKKLTRSRSWLPRGVLGLPPPSAPLPPGLSTLDGVRLPLGGGVCDIFEGLFVLLLHRFRPGLISWHVSPIESASTWYSPLPFPVLILYLRILLAQHLFCRHHTPYTGLHMPHSRHLLRFNDYQERASSYRRVESSWLIVSVNCNPACECISGWFSVSTYDSGVRTYV